MLTVGVLTTCRSCGAGVIWMMTANGARIPVNAESARHGETIYERGRHVSHFATCGDRWRRKR